MGRTKKSAPNRADGMYEVKVTVGKTWDGKLIRKSFYSSVSKESAKAKAEQYKIDQAVADATGDRVVTDGMVFDVWAVKWLETYKKGKVKDHTYTFTYQKNIEKYLIPHFGKAKLTDIRQIDIQNYFNIVRHPVTGDFLSLSTLDKQKTILKAIFDAAIDNDLCRKNPVKNITIGNVMEKKIRPVLTRDQACALSAYAIDQGRQDIALIIATGMRRSEIIGLMWDDIDFVAKSIHVQRAVTQTTGQVIIGDTKSAKSDRIIPIDDATIDMLHAMPRTSRYVVPGDDADTPATPHSYADKFERFMRDASAFLGIPKVTPHELRHTYGTLLRERGVDIYTIQKVMGHSDISVTIPIPNSNTKTIVVPTDKSTYYCQSDYSKCFISISFVSSDVRQV